MDFERRDFEKKWILSNGILSRRGKMRRANEIEPHIQLSAYMDEGRSEITTSLVVNNEQKKENMASAKAEFPDKHRIA